MRSALELSADDILLDQQIVDIDGGAVGKIDDLEFTEAPDGGPPVLTAILCGPAALGPRIGGRLGRWWTAIGKRLRPTSRDNPNRIPMREVDSVNRAKVKLLVSRDVLDTDRFRDWTRDHIIARIPGAG